MNLRSGRRDSLKTDGRDLIPWHITVSDNKGNRLLENLWRLLINRLRLINLLRLLVNRRLVNWLRMVIRLWNVESNWRTDRSARSYEILFFSFSLSLPIFNFLFALLTNFCIRSRKQFMIKRRNHPATAIAPGLDPQ